MNCKNMRDNDCSMMYILIIIVEIQYVSKNLDSRIYHPLKEFCKSICIFAYPYLHNETKNKIIIKFG